MFLWHWFNEMHSGACGEKLCFLQRKFNLSSLRCLPVQNPSCGVAKSETYSRLSNYHLVYAHEGSSETVSVEVKNTSGNSHKVSHPFREKTYPTRFTKNYFLQFKYLSKSERNFLTNRNELLQELLNQQDLNSQTFQILLENLTTNMMYSLKIQGSSESLYSPGKVYTSFFLFSGVQFHET